MPRHVDHEARRAEVAAIAAELIARRGLDGVSLRDVAAAAECSTTVVTHYFTGKRELLEHAYRSAVAATERRLAQARAAEGGDRLLALCEAILPMDRARRRTWQTWFAFFGVAAADEELAGMQRRRVAGFRALLAEALAGDGVGAPEAAARELMALLHGIASEAVFDPADWPPERQRMLVQDTLRRLRAPEDDRRRSIR